MNFIIPVCFVLLIAYTSFVLVSRLYRAIFKNAETSNRNVLILALVTTIWIGFSLYNPDLFFNAGFEQISLGNRLLWAFWFSELFALGFNVGSVNLMTLMASCFTAWGLFIAAILKSNLVLQAILVIGLLILITLMVISFVFDFLMERDNSKRNNHAS